MARRARLATGLAVISMILLVGCQRGNYFTSGSTVEAVSRAAPQAGTTFTQNLAHEYAAFAAREQAEADYGNADHFGRKGLAAARGQAVPPDNIANYNIAGPARAEMADAGSRLNAVLDGGARERMPAVAAHAQERYDCWLEEQEEGWEADEIAKCRDGFMQAMAQLTAATLPPAAAQAPPAPAARQFQVYFDFDKDGLTPDAQRIVEQAAQAAKQSNSSIDLVGRADRAGPDLYNLHLSDRRAQRVVNALVAQGIPRDRISARGVGEREPPVPTPDGVREARNRVVDITLH